MKVTVTEVTLELPNGVLGIPVKAGIDELRVLFARGTDADVVELSRVDGARVVLSKKVLRERLIALTEIEAQVTDARIALPGTPNFPGTSNKAN